MSTFKKHFLKSREVLREAEQCIEQIRKKFGCVCFLYSRVIPEGEGNMVEFKILSDPPLSVDLTDKRIICSSKKLTKEVMPILQELASA